MYIINILFENHHLARGVRRVNIKMMRSHVCNNCNKRLSSYHSLWRHKRNAICKGKGIDIPIPSKFSGKEELTRLLDGDSPKEEPIKELDSDDTEDHSDIDDTEDDVLWERFAMSINRGDTDDLEYLEDYIDLYMKTKTCDLCENIMDDMVRIKNAGYSLSDATDFAVCKHREDIVEAVRDCGEIDEFWYMFSLRVIQDGCLWFTGEKCLCNECKGTSLLRKVADFIKMFYRMDHDEIIQKIVKDGDIKNSVQRHQAQILERLEQAKDLIKTLGIIDNPNRPKFNYKNDTESESESETECK